MGKKVTQGRFFGPWGGGAQPIVNTRLTLIKQGSHSSPDLALGLHPPRYTFKRGPLKKLFLLAVLVVLVAPFNASAGHKRHIRASEMAGVGVGAAALVGIAGYFLLRRRQDS
jgi:MYXO-CTERM domain-containing protein